MSFPLDIDELFHGDLSQYDSNDFSEMNSVFQRDFNRSPSLDRSNMDQQLTLTSFSTNKKEKEKESKGGIDIHAEKYKNINVIATKLTPKSKSNLFKNLKGKNRSPIKNKPRSSSTRLKHVPKNLIVKKGISKDDQIFTKYKLTGLLTPKEKTHKILSPNTTDTESDTETETETDTENDINENIINFKYDSTGEFKTNNYSFNNEFSIEEDDDDDNDDDYNYDDEENVGYEEDLLVFDQNHLLQLNLTKNLINQEKIEKTYHVLS
eukprot:Anaeramoba_flamelloidesa87943_36.p1 GENE.a87943_36~~a87943_36.p1  ORF type:complete len:265 (-),score=60.11 a87943_36:120-914(-)